jgi:hypothetical protein
MAVGGCRGSESEGTRRWENEEGPRGGATEDVLPVPGARARTATHLQTLLQCLGSA